MEQNLPKMSFEDIEVTVLSMYNYLKTNDPKCILGFQDEIKILKQIDESMKTYSDYENKNYNGHTPARILMFLINYFGEMAFNNAEITIYNDDPSFKPLHTHTNTYKLILKDLDTHTDLMNTNPTAKDRPYDFDTIFIEQLTDNNPTLFQHAYDGFRKRYAKPKRTLDFKSAICNSLSHTHNVDYILKLVIDEGKIAIKLYNLRANEVTSNDTRKLSDLIPSKLGTNNTNKKFLIKYRDALSMFDDFTTIYAENNYWGHFILGDDK